MKRCFGLVGSGVLLLLAACSEGIAPNLAPALTQDPATVFINEIHYDNAGADAAEAVEIAGPAGTDLSGWSVVLYNGTTPGASVAYDTDALSGVIPDQGNGYGTVSLGYPANGIQNGSPDGLALLNGATLIQFLSYEGVMTAANGPASGQVSTDIAVSESGTESLGLSLQLKGSGSTYQDFTWAAASTASFGSVNVGQTFDGEGGPVEPPETVCVPAPEITSISVVQGTGETTPCAAQTLSVEGVVVGDYEGASPALRGFYLQEEPGDQDADPATSEGIFVFNNGAQEVTLGETVRVTGTVGEFQGQTQISARSVSVVSSGPTDLEPVSLTLPLESATALEAFEGMYVAFPQTLSVTELFQLGRFGQVLLSSGGRLPQPTSVAAPGSAAASVQAANDLNQILVDDALQSQNPDPIVFGRGGQPLSAGNTLRGGDTVTNLTGVLTYTWGGNSASPNAYRVRSVGDLSDLAADSDVPVFEAANPRPTAAPDVGGSVRVASFNVLNYFLTLDSGGTPCGPDGAKQECRGAETGEELARQQAKLTAALSALDADIFGLIELENTTGVEPLTDIVNRLNTVKGAGTYSFVTSGTVGTDAIKVGLVYRVASVTPIGTPLIDSSPVHNRPPLAQLFEDAEGARFSVVVNHFKSKGCDGASGADSDQGDGQGCFNATRTAQAEALLTFIDASVTPLDPDVLLIGDLNSYAKEDPLRTLEAAGFGNQTERFGGQDAYSYVFDGQWGYLDHALASSTLAEQVTGSADFHINADEPSVLDYNTNFKSAAQVSGLYAPDAYRTSDHDPVVVGLELDAPEQDPEALLDALQAKVRQLYYDGELSRTRTLVLLTPLELAEVQLERGRESRAERSLRTFEELVRLYRARHYLDAATAQSLRDDSVAIRELL